MEPRTRTVNSAPDTDKHQVICFSYCWGAAFTRGELKMTAVITLIMWKRAARVGFGASLALGPSPAQIANKQRCSADERRVTRKLHRKKTKQTKKHS